MGSKSKAGQAGRQRNGDHHGDGKADRPSIAWLFAGYAVGVLLLAAAAAVAHRIGWIDLGWEAPPDAGTARGNSSTGAAGGVGGPARPATTMPPSTTDIGQRRMEELPTPQDMRVRVVSTAPRVYLIENFLSSEECDFLRHLVSGRLEPAKVVQKAENKYDLQHQTRNNKQIWLSHKEEREVPVLRHILKRMHRTAQIPDDDAEALQVGQYSVGEKYEMHLDSDPRNDVARPATMIVYLNDVEAGGETFFPVHKKKDCSAKWRTDPTTNERIFGARLCCENPDNGTVVVKARKGRAVLFFNHDTANDRDPLAEHAACPVKAGEKWIAQRWFRYSPYQRIVHPLDDRFDGLPSQAATDAQSCAAGDAATCAASAEMRPGLGEVRTLSQKAPRAYLIEDFLSEAECRYLIELAQRLPVHEENSGSITRRWVPPHIETSDNIVSAIVKRMHRAARVPEPNGEHLQFGRYEAGGSLHLHHDSDPKIYTLRNYTMIVYLEGTGIEADGGATVIPRQKCASLETCCAPSSGALRIPPKAGRALLLANHWTNGAIDQAASHGSCPAGPNGKWVIQRWFRPRKWGGLTHRHDPQFELPKHVE